MRVEFEGKIHEFPDDFTPEEVESALSATPPVKQSADPLGLNPVGPTIKRAAELRVGKMGPFRKSLYGAERSLDESALGLKQLTAGLTPEDESELAIRRSMEDQIPGTWKSRLAADMVQYAAPTKLGLAAAGKLTKLPNAIRNMVGAGGSGAAIAASQPVLGNESRSANAATGAVFGLGGQVAGDVVGGAIKGLIPKNPSITSLPGALRDRLSLGQTADHRKFMGQLASSTEEKLQSIPAIGSVIKGKRARATDAWRGSMLDKVTPPGVNRSGDGTREQLDSIYTGFKSKYKEALRGQQIPPSPQFEQAVLNIVTDPKSGVLPQTRENVQKIVMDYYKSAFQGRNPPTGPAGTTAVPMGGHRGSPISMDAEDAKNFEAFLGAKARQYASSTTPESTDMARMFTDIERAWSTLYKRRLPSSVRKQLKPLDQQYAPFKTVSRAASSVGNDFGDFTPQQLLGAVKARTPENQFSRGRGILQKDAEKAKDIFVDRVPNSGTADRAITFSALMGLLADPVTTGTIAASTIPATSTKLGRNLMTGDTSVQKLLQKLRVDKALQGGGALTGASFQDLLNSEYTE